MPRSAVCVVLVSAFANACLVMGKTTWKAHASTVVTCVRIQSPRPFTSNALQKTVDLSAIGWTDS